MDAAVTTLSALAVFASTLHQGAVRSVHGYRVVGVGGGRLWDRWVEREFAFSPSSCREVPLPAAAPRILPVEWRGRPAYREGQVLGAWRCVLAFDSLAAAALPPTPPPMLCPFRNPGLVCVPSLYSDLYMVFQFQRFQQAPQLVQRDSDEKPTRLDAEDNKTSDEVEEESGSDSDEDPQSGEELSAQVERRRRAKKQHIASITLVDIAPYFHLPIREASRALKIGVSILKKKCRQYGIPRWPHRKIKSLDSLISDLEFVMDDTDGDAVQKETCKQREKEKKKEEKDKQNAIQALAKRKRLLESEKETIQQKPALDLMAETKLFREDVFKRRYRAKRLPGQL
ncbi:hypothetical protein D1007_30904 [Hordeum vulgare]|nr:hypothetical protein D1007_30904 [Hordeum vulgare]KAI5011652.1 hypothetical protein ZWY2020_013789 [Hordeum vulgare]